MPRHRQLVSHIIGWTMVGAMVILLLAAIGVGAITYDRAYADRIFPGVRIGPVPVGGLTRADATVKLQTAVDAFLERGLTVVLGDRAITVDPIVSSPQDPDLSYALIAVDVAASVDAAFAVGRTDGFTTAWTERVRGAVGGEPAVAIRATVDDERFERAITEAFGGAVTPMEPPRIRAAAHRDGIAWTVSDGRPGQRIRTAAAVAAAGERAAALDPAAIVLAAEEVPLPYTKAAVTDALPALDAAVRRAPLTLTHDERRWTVDAAALAGWMALDADGRPMLDPAAVAATLAPIADAIERTPEDARFTIDPTTKRVREFRTARDGVRMDRDALAVALHAAVFGTATPLIPIPIVRAAPTVALGSTNDLGIRELLGAGRSKFSGSPPNRRHNIGIGTRLLNGLVIVPGEEFSLVAALAPFDASNGYKPELVIKENRTIPEFGGGLCQVATTMFRAALAAGVPITERTNHAYRVPYYEPPVGKDATIYGPKPDFRFRNDTGAHLLIRARVVGDELVYEIWGTNDGRVAEQSESEVFNITPPPPTKTVETENLKPGERKCTERAHTGADARFTYTVTYADGRKVARVFKSHYRPWQAVCLIGKKPEADSQKPEAAIEPGSPAPVAPVIPPSSDVPIGGAN